MKNNEIQLLPEMVKTKTIYGYTVSALELAKIETELSQVKKNLAFDIAETLDGKAEIAPCENENGGRGFTCDAQVYLEVDEDDILPFVERAFTGFEYYLRSEVWRDRK